MEKQGRGKVNPGQNLFGGRRHMFGMALMAKGKESYINIGAMKLKEMNPNAIINKIKHNTCTYTYNCQLSTGPCCFGFVLTNNI